MIFFYLLLLPMFSSAESSPKEAPVCGIYAFKGTLKVTKESPRLPLFVVNEGTQEETLLEIPDPEDFRKIGAHLDQTLSLEAHVKEPISKMRGRIYELKKIQLRVPNPLADIGYQQIKAMKCN